VGIPLPGETTLVAAAIYAGVTHNLSLPAILVTAAAAAIIGDNIGYVVGRWGGYRVLVRFGHYIRIRQKEVKVARYLFDRHGGKVVFLGRFVAILRTYAAFLAGTTRMRWRRFLFFNACGGIVWASVYSVGAYYAGDTIKKVTAPVAIVFGIVGIVVMVAITVTIRKGRERLSEDAERAYPGPLAGYEGGQPIGWH
jgi:membrane protein DedA with SNARE-associated domain